MDNGPVGFHHIPVPKGIRPRMDGSGCPREVAKPCCHATMLVLLMYLKYHPTISGWWIMVSNQKGIDRVGNIQKGTTFFIIRSKPENSWYPTIIRLVSLMTPP